MAVQPGMLCQRPLAGCASQWYSANVEENLQKFSKMDAFPPEYQGPTWLNWRF